MTVKYKQGFKPKQIASDLKSELNKKLGVIISDEVTQMKLRTQRGQDVDGRQFKDYTPEYKAYKQAKGRNVGVPDLLLTGAMQQAITQTVKTVGSEIQAQVYFSSAKEGEKARGNIKEGKRKFFGFSQEQIKRIKDKITLALKGAYDRR